MANTQMQAAAEAGKHTYRQDSQSQPKTKNAAQTPQQTCDSCVIQNASQTTSFVYMVEKDPTRTGKDARATGRWEEIMEDRHEPRRLQGLGVVRFKSPGKPAAARFGHTGR